MRAHRLARLRRRRCPPYSAPDQSCRHAHRHGRLAGVFLLLLAAVLAAGVGALTHRPLAGAGVVVVLLVVAAVTWLRRRTPARPGWPPGGGPGGGTAGVREPRHPHPSPPAGALALPTPEVRDDEVAALA